MSRQHSIKVSKQEKKLLDEVLERWFGTEEISYGYVLERLCMEKLALFEVAEDYESGNYVYERKRNFSSPDDIIDTSENEGINK